MDVCVRGHVWTPENTYTTKAGYRHCRKCCSENQKKGKAMAKASGLAWPPRRRTRPDVYMAKSREWSRKSRDKIRKMVHEIKASTGCADCDERHPACLQFHHNNKAEKEERVNRAVARKWAWPRILAEIAKCTVLCANCHAKRHWKELHGEVAA